MHLSTRYTKQLISYTLSIQLCLLGVPLKASAGDADAYIEKTHKMAKAQAKSLMNDTLIQAHVDGNEIPDHRNSEQVKELMTRIQTDLNSNLQQLEPLLNIAPVDAAKLTGKELTSLSQEFRKTIVDLRLNKRFAYDLVAQVKNQRGIARKIILDFLDNLDHQCSEGVAIDPFNEMLPALHPLMPSYEFNYTGTVYGQDNGEGAGNRKVMIGNGPEAAALWTTLYAINVVAVGYYLTGNLMFMQATNAALLGGFAVTFVIALVALAVMTYEAQQESERMVKDQRRMFNERASLEDGRHYFQEECRTVRGYFGDLTTTLNKLDSGDTDSIKQLESESVEAAKIMQGYVTILRAYEQKKSALFGDLTESSSPEQKKAASKALDQSEEGTRLKEIGEKLTPEKLVGMIKVSLLNNFRKSVQIADTIDPKALNLDLAALELRNRALRELAYLQNGRESGLEVNTLWQKELKQSHEMAALYADLDKLILRKARWIFSLEKDLKYEELANLNAEMAKWYERLKSTLAQYPKSELLQQLKNDLSPSFAR